MPTRVDLVGVEVASANPAPFGTPFTIRVVLHVIEDPPQGTVDVKFTWSPIWDFPVDQELDELEVGPFHTLGRHVLMLECDPPALSEIPDPTGPTALMVSLCYGGQEFIHLGFNVETVSSLADTPEVYTDPSVLTRKIGRCYRKTTDIRWDCAPTDGSGVAYDSLDALVADPNRPVPRHDSDEDDEDSSSADDDDLSGGEEDRPKQCTERIHEEEPKAKKSRLERVASA